MKKIRTQFFRLIEFIKARDLLIAFLLAVAIIILAIVIGKSNDGTIPLFHRLHYRYEAEPHNPLSFLANWDAVDYLDIAKHGYQGLFQANFFPLYPLLIKIVGFVIPSPLVSALAISWSALVGAIFCYIKLAKRLFDKITKTEAITSVLYLLFFPSGIFLIAAYSESLYLFLTLAAVNLALSKRWQLSAVCLALLSSLHITAAAVIVLIGLVLWEQKVGWVKIVASVALGFSGLAGFMLYLWVRLGQPLAFIKAQEQIHGWLRYHYINLIHQVDALNIIFIVLIIINAIYWWPKRRSFAIYGLLLLAIPLVGEKYGGFNRYVLMVFPIQLMLFAYFRNKIHGRFYGLMLMTIGWTYFALQYLAGYIGN